MVEREETSRGNFFSTKQTRLGERRDAVRPWTVAGEEGSVRSDAWLRVRRVEELRRGEKGVVRVGGAEREGVDGADDGAFRGIAGEKGKEESTWSCSC